MIKKILIPTDGSEYGKKAIDYGISIARKLEAELVGLHVMDTRLLQGPVIGDVCGSIGIPPAQEFIPLMEDALHAKADAILKAFRDHCKAAGLEPETRKVSGIIDEVIIAEGQKADWIILAQRGEHFHLGGGAILGTTAESVVRKSGKPVMVTPAAFREIESMALAYDGSPPAEAALRLAVPLSERAAWPLTVLIVGDDQKGVAKLSSRIEVFCEPYLVDCEIIRLRGREDREILRFIQEGAVELLVMGAYGHNLLRELLVGSTTSAVIRKSPIPVLLTRR